VVLGLIAALAVGLVSIALLPRTDAGRASRAIGWLPVPLLTYNLWLAACLALEYLRLHVLDRMGGRTAADVVNGGLLVSHLLGAGWLYAHILLVERLRGLETGDADRMMRSVPALLAAVPVFAFGVFRVTGNQPSFMIVVGVAGLCLPCAALAASVRLLVWARRFPEPEWRSAVSALAGGYVVLFSAITALGATARWLETVAPGLAFVGDMVLGVAYNVTPVVWSRRQMAGPAVEQPAIVPADQEAHVEAFVMRYGITRRERDVIELICRGKTNQEIAARLFISLQTVKDHNYVIFQKTGVRNRTELAGLFRGCFASEASNSDDSAARSLAGPR